MARRGTRTKPLRPTGVVSWCYCHYCSWYCTLDLADMRLRRSEANVEAPRADARRDSFTLCFQHGSWVGRLHRPEILLPHDIIAGSYAPLLPTRWVSKCRIMVRVIIFHLTLQTDVIKVRLMNDKDHRYKGVTDCVRSITMHEGPLAFYKVREQTPWLSFELSVRNRRALACAGQGYVSNSQRPAGEKALIQRF
jgi:hypothetical protein